MTAPGAGFVYFAIVFAAGFVLGTLRVFVIAPATGETAAILAELPLILGISWLVAGYLTRGRPALASAAARLLMGATAFAFLMTAETMLSTLVFGDSVSGRLQRYTTFSGAAGLAGQIVFAALPWMRLHVRERSRRAGESR